MPQLGDENEKVTNSVIPNGTEAKVMRNLIENKGLLNGKGKLYAGTADTTSTGAPVTTAIDPTNASEGSVLIKDSSQVGGWKVDQIGPTNIIPKSLTGNQIADGAIGNSKLDITDQIELSPSLTIGSASHSTILSAYTAPYGSSKTVMVRFPRYSGTLVTEDDVAEQYVKRDLITTECNGDYKLPNGTIVGPNGVDITLQFIGPDHMEGGDTAGVVTNVTKAENAISWEGSVKSWDSSGKIVLNLKDSTQMLTRLPWDIQVTYYQSAYSAVNAEKTSFSNGAWQEMSDVLADRYLEKNTFYYIKFTYIDFLYSGIIYTDCPSGANYHLIWSSYGEDPSDKTSRGVICLFTTDEGDAQKCKIDGTINSEYNLFDSVTSINYLKIR